MVDKDFRDRITLLLVWVSVLTVLVIWSLVLILVGMWAVGEFYGLIREVVNYIQTI